MICSDNDNFHDVNFDIFYEIIASLKELTSCKGQARKV